MQEKAYSCSIACACTLIHLFNDGSPSEAEIRILSQQFYGGYRSSPSDINGRKPTFIHSLRLFGEGFLLDMPIGTRSSAVSDVLAQYNLHSDEEVLAELSKCTEDNYISKLKDKVVLLSAKTKTGRHSIIIRDVWDDGTIVIYDPEDGLIETKDITKVYDINTHEIETMDSHCAFAVYQHNEDQLINNFNKVCTP